MLWNADKAVEGVFVMFVTKFNFYFQKTSGTGIQNSLNVLVDTYCLLFSHVTSSNVIFNLIGHLAQPIGELLSDASKKTSVKVFNNSFQQKVA